MFVFWGVSPQLFLILSLFLRDNIDKHRIWNCVILFSRWVVRRWLRRCRLFINFRIRFRRILTFRGGRGRRGMFDWSWRLLLQDQSNMLDILNQVWSFFVGQIIKYEVKKRFGGETKYWIERQYEAKLRKLYMKLYKLLNLTSGCLSVYGSLVYIKQPGRKWSLSEKET